MKKLWVRVVFGAAALLILAVVFIPFLINVETFKPTLESQLSGALGRKVSMGHLGFSLLGGSLVADNIQIADDPAFGNAPFLQAKSLEIGVEAMPFLLHRQLRITRITVDSPSIQLIHSEEGAWNFSSLGGAAPTAPQAQQQSAFPDLTVGELRIKDGSATVTSLPSTRKPIQYSKLNLSVKQFSFAKAFPFELSASLPGDGVLQLSGEGGPVSPKDTADTPFHASLKLTHFDPVDTGVVESGEGISMLADFDGQVASDGSSLTSKGKIRASKLHLARTGAPAPNPVDIDYSVSHELEARTGRVSDIAIHAGSIAAHIKGTYRITPQAEALDLRVSAPNLPVDEVERLLPAFGVTLPSGSSLHGGSLSANLTVTGTSAEPVLAGPVEVDNTKLVGFDLGSKIGGMNPFGGTGGGTEIQKLRADVNCSPQLTRLGNIDAELPQIGSATGSGSVTASEALDFKLVAKFSPNSGVGAIAGKALNEVAGQASETVGMVKGFLGQFRKQPSKKAAPTTSGGGILLTITGTAASPIIKANLGAMFK